MSAGHRIAAVATGVALIVGVTTPAIAKTPPPKVNLKIGGTLAQGTFGKPVPFSFTAAHIPAGAHVVLQDQVGTKHVWKTVKVLKGSAGKGTVSAGPVGKYLWRVVVLSKKNKGLTSVKRLITIYQDGLPIVNICGEYGNYTGLNCQNTEAITVGTVPFVWFIDQSVSLQPTQLFSISKSTCRHVDLIFGIRSQDYAERPGNTVTLTLAQSVAAPVTVTAALDVPGTLSADIDHGPWSVTGSSSVKIQNAGGAEVYIGGTMSCYTATGG